MPTAALSPTCARRHRARWTRRILALALAGAAGAAALAQAPQGLRVRITSPLDDEPVSGPLRLVALVEPPTAIRDVKEVVFYAGGVKVCTVTRLPFVCDWDAGGQIVEHMIRAKVELKNGGTAVTSIHTRGVAFEEIVDVDVLQLAVVVKDEDGRFVTGLKREDFTVYDNGQPQPITAFQSENVGLELVVAVDMSSSMKQAMPHVKESARRFLGALRPGDYVTLLSFNDTVYTPGPRAQDAEVRIRAIDQLRAWGGTALYDVIVTGLRQLAKHPGRRSLLIFSDGDDQSSHASLQSAFNAVEGSDATVYTIGQGRAVKTKELQDALTRFARISGGRAFFTEDVGKLDDYFSEILDDLSHQYLISYAYPGEKRDGKRHEIRVETRNKSHNVRSRDSFTAAPR